jgi:hypothetical protein
MIEITHLAKRGGPLTKRIFLAGDGTYQSDGSACVMAEGDGHRVELAGVEPLADIISQMEPHEALALGTLEAGRPDKVGIVTKAKLNGSARPDLIARTAGAIVYRPRQPAFALLDYDLKGMPAEAGARIDAAGGYWSALVTVIPALADVARVVRRSTSAGLYREDTGEKLPGSYGMHVYVEVEDGADIPRFLSTLHERCWLAGLGWSMVGAGGQLLERSIVDRTVGAPERLVFEGAPILVAPLAQNADSRRPVATEGVPLDTVATCPPLTILETARLVELRAQEAQRLTAERARVRDEFIKDRAAALSARTGMSSERARRIVARQCDGGVLYPSEVLPFDDPALAGRTVADVLADPAGYEGETLADPLEGVDYGRCKARIMREADGWPWVHSFAHGRTTYRLRYDAASVEAAIGAAGTDQIVDLFVSLALRADLAEPELERLRDIVAGRANVGKRALDRMLRRNRAEEAREQAQREKERRAATRRDPRPQVPAPMFDAPWLPQMAVLNGVLGASDADEPPMRDIDGHVVAVRDRRATNLHALTADGTNEGDNDETRLPAPEQPLLTRLDEAQLAELIERHVDYVDTGGRSVHLAGPFVKHFLVREDAALPVVSAVATLPIVLPNGEVLSGRGLDRDRAIVFRVPDELLKIMPKREDCVGAAVAEAMRFLADDWLCDVATADYGGKAVLIAMLATIIERHALPERPAFNITAGQRGGGKTTTVNMIAMAALGQRAPAAAWSPSDEERRKGMLAYLGQGVPLLVWDNIPRGETISCPSIEKALTAETYQDRVLGISEFKIVSASTIMAFTGNNITAYGDLASRTLNVRLEVERPDPENREFEHADPLAWTAANRGKILQSIYTILLGNPRLTAKEPAAAETRFKTWWHLVGSAIENAAREHAEVQKRTVSFDEEEIAGRANAAISFKLMFLEGESEEELTSSIIEVLVELRRLWPNGFEAAMVAEHVKHPRTDAIDAFLGAIEQASKKPFKAVSTREISWRLGVLEGTPVRVTDDEIWRLCYQKSRRGGKFTIKVTNG